MSKLKLLHWNILFTEKSENILPLVEKINPDIFCCQEISDANDNLVQKVAQLFKYYYYEPAEIVGSSDEKLALGNAIFSVYPLSAKRRVFLWNGPNPTSSNKHEERIYIESTIDYKGKKIKVGTTHLSFAPYFDTTPDRKEQAAKLLETVKENRRDFILTGDFNSAPGTSIVKDIEKRLVSAGPPHDKPTFSTIPFTFLGFTVKGLDWRVDYVFASQNVKIVSSKIINTQYSDHLPILIVAEV